MTDKIIENILKKVKNPGLIEVLTNKLSFSELQSILIKIFNEKVSKRKPWDILNEYKTSRFSKPSDVSPVDTKKLELDIFSLLPPGFEIIELSPLAPIGTTSKLTTVHQNNVVSTIRNMEVSADSTNILALECAKRREEILKTENKSAKEIKLCSSQRLVRAQPFENKNFSAHFNVIALCTAGKDTGNDEFELKNLQEHIDFYINIIKDLIKNEQVKKINVKFFDLNGSVNTELIHKCIKRIKQPKNIDFIINENSHFGKNYYHRIRFMISVINQNNEEFDYIDGGFTKWTSVLLNNKKERLLTSGIGTDFLLRTMEVKKLK